MSFDSKRLVRRAVAGAVLATFALAHNILAQEPEHLVDPSVLQQATVDATQTRQQNLDTLNQFFSSDKATQALKASHMNPQEVKSAVSTLTDQELAQLASRAGKVQRQFAAGNMSDRDLLIILVAIAALILIIVAVR